ncbi:MAG: HEAT repeat domain-containing protein [Polyangiaceae bacterium]
MNSSPAGGPAATRRQTWRQARRQTRRQARRQARGEPGAEPGGDPTAEPGGKPGGKEEKGPGKAALIQRYTGIVLAQPGAPFPLQRLAELYRERDGNIEKLIQDFEKRAAEPDQWNALVALAGIYKQDGQHDRAISTYEKAIGQKPSEPTAVMALANLLADRGDKSSAVTRYEAALPLLKNDADKEQVLRTLMQLSLDLKRFDDAKKHHKALVARAKGSFYVRGELGRELMLRGDYDHAVEEYRDVVKAATGDNRVLGPAQRDLGKALARQGKRKEAMEMLQKALKTAGSQAGIRREIYEITVEVYRAEDRLRDLITELEAQHLSDPEQLRMLGSLYEETGQVDKALTTYKQALAKKSDDVGTRLKVVQLLQIQGELDEAIKQYEELIRAAPRNPDYVFQLAEALIQRGDRAKALEHLKKLEARSGADEETLAALVDFYERVEEKQRAMDVLQRLSKSGRGDPRHLVELGDRYWQEGDKNKAQQTWARIKIIVPDKARANEVLSEVYLEHDMPQQAIEALREAMKLQPKAMKYKKAYALALERTGASAGSIEQRNHQYDEARKIWDAIAKEAGDGNEHVAREARQHIVTLWGLGGQLEQRAVPLDRRLKGTPPDLEAGRLLAEVQIRLRRYGDAERTLNFVAQKAPGDVGTLTQLERVLVLRRKLKEAIAVLKKLTDADPKRAREYYQRMAGYAAELYRDDEAIQYAAKAVELSPDDAEGHKKLGEMYRRRQDTSRAINAFRQAIAKNDRLFTVHFQLAELLMGQGELEEADRLLRRVVRASPDEDLVAQAARLSMQVNLGKGTLESLEKELLPVALGNPQKPLYRRLLVELYGAMAFPLAHQTRSPDKEVSEKARAELKRIGERAVKPLLDALSDEKDQQQRTAIELLGYIENKSAGSALYAFATGSADAELRSRAMLAVGSLKDPGLLPKLADVLAPGGQIRADESDPVIVAAAWSVARMQAREARPLLGKLLKSDAPSLRALGAIGVGLLKDKHASAELAEIARSVDVGALPRAAAAFALGEIGDTTQADALSQLAESSDTGARAAAVIALARLGAAGAPRAISEALVSGDPALAQAASAAALVNATGTYRAPRDALVVPEGRVDVRAVLDRLVPRGYSADEHAKALVNLAPTLGQAALSAAQSSPERARAVADALLSRDGKPAFGLLTRDLDTAEAAARTDAEKAAESIALAVLPAFVALSGHPSAEVRSRAIQLLSMRSEESAKRAVLDAIDDPDPVVQRAALTAVERTRPTGAITAVTRLVTKAKDWPARVRAAEALALLARGSKDKLAVEALRRAALRDETALVREAAITALGKVDAEAAREVAAEMTKKDAEPRVRDAARAVGNGR